MKFYAIKNPSGELVEDAVATTEEQAWQYAGDTDHDFPRHPEYHLSESGEAAGYRCVEVELAEPGTTEALKRAVAAEESRAAKEAYEAGLGVSEWPSFVDDWFAAAREVLGRVTDNAASGEDR